MEKISINPSKVRAYGNIITPKTGADFTVSDCTLIVDTDTVDGELVTVYDLQPSSTILSVSLSVNDNSVLIGESVTLTATVEDGMTNPVSGASVSFKLNGASIGTSTTNNSGIATYTYTCNTAGTLTFSASCMGNNSNNVNVTVTGHDYSLTFSSTSYTTNVSGDATVSAVLTDNGVSVSGATVTFTGGTSTVTATTDSSGVATATVHFTSDGTLTATSNGVSDTCNITVLTYLFYDACDTDNTNLYDTTTNYSNSTFTFDSSNSCYTMQRTSGTGMSSLWIKDLTVTDQVKITADMKLATTNTVIMQGGPIIMNSAKNKGFLTMIEGYSGGDGEYSLGTTNSPNSHGTKFINDQTLGLNARNYWLTYELIIDGSSVELNIYNGSTLIKTGTMTSSQLDSTGNIVGLLMSYNSGAKISVKNIKVESL